MGLTDVSGEAWGTQSRGAPGAEGVDPLRGACSQPERSPGGELCFLLQAMKSRGKQWEGAETTLLAGIVGSWPSAALILGALGLLQLVAHSRPPFMSGTRSEDAGTSPILSVGSTPPLRRGGLAWGRVHAGGSGPEADRQTDRQKRCPEGLASSPSTSSPDLRKNRVPFLFVGILWKIPCCRLLSARCHPSVHAPQPRGWKQSLWEALPKDFRGIPASSY